MPKTMYPHPGLYVNVFHIFCFVSHSGSCDFERASLCTWSNVPNGNTTGKDDFDWDLNSGSTSSWGTGPTVDHTLGTAQGIVSTLSLSRSQPASCYAESCYISL